MEFYYTEKSPEVALIEERLKKMTLAYKVVEGDQGDLPYLKDGSKTYLGEDSMNRYLDVLDSEKEQWYYCNC